MYSWVNVRFFFSFFQFQPLLSILLLFRHCHCLVCCFFLSLSFTFAFCAHHYCSNKKTYTNLFFSLSRRRNNNIIKKEQKTSILHWQEKKRNLTNFPCTITCFFSLSLTCNRILNWVNLFPRFSFVSLLFSFFKYNVWSRQQLTLFNHQMNIMSNFHWNLALNTRVLLPLISRWHLLAWWMINLSNSSPWMFLISSEPEFSLIKNSIDERDAEYIV